MKKGIYVMDFDDILADLSVECYRSIRRNWRKYKKYFWDPGELTTEEVQKRPCFRMGEWLIQSKYKELSSGQYTTLQLKIHKMITDDFFVRDDIYDNLQPTEFAKKTLMNPLFIEDPLVSSVVILTRSLTKSQEESKERFIKKYFSNPKISVITVRGNESKAQALRENKIYFDVVVDDEIPNIRGIAEEYRDELEKKEFIIPEYGYNKMPPDLKLLIEGKGGSFTYYNPFKK